MTAFCLKWRPHIMQLEPDRERLRLREILVRKSVQRSRKFKLASGGESDVYIDAKRTTCFAEAMPLIGRAFLGKIAECGWSPQAVGGKTLGADPIAISIARESIDRERFPPINAFIVRKEPK